MSEGFAEYAAARYERLCRIGYLLSHNWMTAEDLTQTALVRAWGAWHRIDGDPDPYVYRIIINTYTSWSRRHWRNEIPQEVMPERAEPSDFSQRIADSDVIWAALRGLAPRQRAVVVLYYFEELTLQQIAHTLDCSLGTVKSQMSRALKRLRVNPALEAMKVKVAP
ncbi:RNA polymerase [Sphaerisporangium krabiense]|uniref:RNA polymerase sigma-70 factor (Sigma-E family) n=1 Tax=Sphaerisporangium krabiense TaxID=763782 RepID=A0A7W9DSG1_9ACTN|nr:SigE family RNA polymerase sigma factor [Sphaerisporangium krabiense]MBB5629677.1 RNA polymerase sigma-70 factor (sigma-E family) [Sphaerisporangium krabiense]GII63775.1 RNA polymerase [Sphaerisporangium krabiense]